MFNQNKTYCALKAAAFTITTLLTALANPVLAENEYQAVEPMLQTTWGQSGGYNPNFTYNNKTPFVGLDQSKRAPVGCIAVAFGQVLKYYDYPKKGIGYNSYCNSGGSMASCADPVEAAFYLESYNWNEMPSKLDYFSSSESIDAVSTLLYHIGASVNVKYDAKGSAAKLENPAIVRSFRKHFAMPDIETVFRANYSQDDWADLIINEIISGRPVVMVGFHADNGAGHAYVLDGLNSEGEVHVNWGWNNHRNENGYYDLHRLESIYGSFTEGLFALVNFTPNIKKAGQSCNGSQGERCETGLACVSNETGLIIDDYLASDEYGTCATPSEVIDPTLIETQIVTEEATVAKNQWLHFGPFSTEQNINVVMSGDGDADLYLRKDEQATASNYDCRPYKSSSNETCQQDDAGEYYVSVMGYGDTSNIKLSITTQVLTETSEAN